MEKLFTLNEYEYQMFFKLYDRIMDSSVCRTENLGDLMRFCHKHDITPVELAEIHNMIDGYNDAIFGLID